MKKVQVTNVDGILTVIVRDEATGEKETRPGILKSQLPEVVKMLSDAVDQRIKDLEVRLKERDELQELAEKVLAGLDT